MNPEKVWAPLYQQVPLIPFELLRRIRKRLNQRQRLFRAFENRLPVHDPSNPPRVLEVACGMGIEANLLSLAGYRVTGIDIEEESIRLARHFKDFLKTEMSIAKGDAFRLDFPDHHFDCVYSQGFLEHFHDEDVVRLIREQFRVLKPGGFLLIDVPNRWSAYTLYKAYTRLVHGGWHFGFERSFSPSRLRAFVRHAGGGTAESTRWGWSFYGYPVKAKFDYIVMAPLLLVRALQALLGRGQDNVCLWFGKS